MKKFKKVFAVLLTLAMVLGMSMTTFAANNKPTASDKQTASVTNVEAGATVTAYQIVKANYNDAGFVGYSAVDGVTIANPLEPTSAEVTTIAKNVSSLNLTSVTMTAIAANKTTYLAQLSAGYWIVLVDGTVQEVYNPMLVGVYYTIQGSGSDNTLVEGSVNANDNWSLATSGAYAKSSELSLTKRVNDDTREVGQGVEFTITTTIPSYSDSYTNPTFTIKDEITNGLAYTDADPVVKVGESVVDEANYTLTKNTTDFTVTFNSAYLKGLVAVGTNRAVEIKYTATVTSAAVATPAVNTATLTYSNTPSSTATKTATEKVFTFKLDGVLKKVKEDKTTPLAGAEFTLYRNSALTDSFGTATSDTNGNIKFEGIGAKDLTTDIEAAAVKYYLKETKAPNGYTINDKVYEIEIKDITRDPSTNDVTAYKVYVDNNEIASVTIAGEVTGNGTSIVNTKLAALPGTGGIGTTIFTIGGCLIMIIAAALFFANRRKAK
ncbi:SpaH/EbpB family LPXTG-anchored major pilin [Faecalicatena contorta]|uniref:SpaH/EbpB family LPXTG-anchored major pilin n=1 Tax=Faecalicatena contorta TaxID=39482 RepID=UPI001F19F646|nr:SpaH/EbpB family LPXTG-anchored major pilin [Faecalicatena contorta]MCF2553960.1 SpaH/EbpB family LPXTG-anchored major pilin [Faecalicatena contorta]